MSTRQMLARSFGLMLCAAFLAHSVPVAAQVAPAPFVEHGGGAGPAAYDRPAPDEDREAILERLVNLVDSLRAAGVLPALGDRAMPPLQWPMKPAPDYQRPGYHGISNFVDHDPNFPNALLDYHCGARTYDTATGYNHDGTDYFLWPFQWALMDDDAVQVVAAAPGTVIFRRDGFNDRHCTWGHGEPANVIYIGHDDGSVARYLHLKRHSLTPKQVGETVAAGEYLGVVGSSGNSTGPHLHFDVWQTTGGNLLDPYAGACNSMNASSLWAQQRPYYDSSINAIITHSAPPQFPQCPNTHDVVNERRQFDPGETIYLAFYYRDQLAGQISLFRILRPDGTTFHSWSHSSPAPHYLASYWWWSLNLPVDAPQGTYTVEAVYQGQLYTTTFDFGKVTSTPDDPPAARLEIDLFPNPVTDRMSMSVRGAGAEPVRVAIIDLLGREVLVLREAEVVTGTLHLSHDISALAAGIYVVHVEAGAQAALRRLTVLR